MNLNVHIYAYRDAAFLRDAVESVVDILGHVDIHVCDGRYALFGGETDLSPRIRRYCKQHPDCIYHAPPASMLPFGHERLEDGTPETYRPANHEKARWVFDDILPPDEWTLKLDTDERLRRFDADLDDLDEKKRYAPFIERENDTVNVARLWKPEHWTPWINDCLLVRDLFPRDTPLEIRQRFWNVHEFRAFRFLRLTGCGDIHIENRGHERPTDWKERRIDHLEAIGRPEQAKTIGETL